MINEKVKSQIFQEEQNKKIRELSYRINTMKKDQESHESNVQKRDSQLNSLLQKIRHQDQEIARLNSELVKKTATLHNLHGEVVELRPSKEAMNLVEKLSKQIEDLKRLLQSRDSENSMMKDLIKTWQHQYVNNHDKSPRKFPLINSGKSTSLSKKSLVGLSGGTSKSVRYNDYSHVDFDLDGDHHYMLENIIENSDDRERRDDKERALREREEEEERTAKEQVRVENELKMEENERGLMEVEERIGREEAERVAKELEAERKKEQEFKKKNEGGKKSKGKLQSKPAAKTGTRKK